MILNGVDLFAGIGGVSSGWLETGLINPLISVECNPSFSGLSSAYECLHSANFPKGLFLKLAVEVWAARGFPGVKQGDVFIAHGSPPCQHFSQATRGMLNRPLEDETDYRSAIAYAQFLEHTLPPYFTLEQVVGYEKSYSFEAFYNRVSWFYDVQIYRINLKRYGIPQDRLRLFVIGNLSGKAALHIQPTSEHKGWISTLDNLHLVETELTAKQKALALAKGHKNLLLPRVKKCDFKAAKLPYEPYPTLLRSYFTDQNNSNRYEPFSCLVEGKPYGVPLRALARGQGFFDGFKLPYQPVVAGSGIGNAFSPKFIHDFIVYNFGKK